MRHTKTVLDESLNLGLVFVKEGRIEDYNSYFEVLIGHKPDALQGGHFQDLIHEESLTYYQEASASDEEHFNLTLRMKSPNPDPLWARVSYKRSKSEDNNWDLFIVEDVTESQLRELILSRLAEGFISSGTSSIFSSIVLTLSYVFGVEYSFVGIFDELEKKIDIRAISKNNKLVDQFSYGLDYTPCMDVLDKGCLIVNSNAKGLYPDDQDLTDWGIEGYIGVALVDTNQQPIGHLVLMDTKPIVNEDLIVSILKMYSSRLAMELQKEIHEKAIEKNESKYRNLFQNAFEAKLVLDTATNHFLEANRSACELFGYSRNELLALKPEDLKQKNRVDAQGFEQVDKAKKMVKEGQVFREESINVRSDGTAINTEVASSLLDAEKGHVLVSIRDISERKRSENELMNYRSQLENLVEERTKELMASNQSLNERKDTLEKTLEELKVAQDHLIQSKKMASLGVLSAGIGHEINNPLNYIKGGIAALVSYLDNQPGFVQTEVDQYLDIVNRGVVRISEIVSGLSHFSRSGTDMNEVCDVEEVLENCLVILNSSYRDKVTILKDYTVGGLKVVGNEGRLHQVFLNLLSNAEQSIVGKGEVQVSTSLEEGCILTKIKDSGEGIPQKDIEKIMEPFYTTKAPGEGTGLGLAITYNIIKEHVGKLKIISEIGEGTEVQVLLPVQSKT